MTKPYEPTTVQPVLWLRKPEPMPAGWKLLPSGINFVRLVSRTPYCNVKMANNIGGQPGSESVELPASVGQDAQAMAYLNTAFGVELVVA